MKESTKIIRQVWLLLEPLFDSLEILLPRLHVLIQLNSDEFGHLLCRLYQQHLTKRSKKLEMILIKKNKKKQTYCWS